MIYPLNVYYEGFAAVGELLYTYSFGFDSSLLNYRILLQENLTQGTTILLKKNGTTVKSITLNNSTTDTLVQGISGVDFVKDDRLDIAVSAQDGEQLAIIQMTILLGINPQEAGFSMDDAKIQTPLIGRISGALTLDTNFFAYTFTQPASFFAYRILLDEAADADVIVSVRKNGVEYDLITIPEGETTYQGTVSTFFDTGDSLSLVTTQIGPTAGEDLTVIIDYSNPTQEVFNRAQSPFIIEHVNLANANPFFSYIAPRNFTIAIVQAFVEATETSLISIGLYKNGVAQQLITIPIGSLYSAPQLIEIPFTTGQTLSLKLQSPAAINDIVVTLDYTISGNIPTQNFQYYSDPDEQIILIARQAGIGGAKADTLSLTQLEEYKKNVDNVINARLRPLYRTPLIKVSTGTNPWPVPIQRIAQRLVARDFLQDAFTQVEPNQSESIKANATLAMEDLDALTKKQQILGGQRLRALNYGSNPYTEPLTPLTPPPMPNTPIVS